MFLAKIRPLDWLIGVCGLLLFISEFMPWYASGATRVGAWVAFGLTDDVLLIVAALAFSLPFVSGFTGTRSGPQRITALMILVAVIGLIDVIARLINVPEFDTSNQPVAIKYGAWLGLVLLVALIVLGLLNIFIRHPERARSKADTRGKADVRAAS